MIRVLIVDDHEVVRVGLAQLLSFEEDVTVVAEARDGEEAVRLAEQHHPDVVLMDLHLPELDGVGATRRIAAANPSCRIVILTSFSDRGRIVEAIEAGAIGYMLKDATAEELRRGVRSAAAGGSPLSPSAVNSVVRAIAERQDPGLSARELEVLGLLAEGMANRQIARRLSISEKTVKTHVTSIFRHIGVTDRTQAMLWARRHGLVPDGAQRAAGLTGL